MPTAPKASQDVMLLIGQLLEEAKAASDGLKSTNAEIQANGKALIATVKTLELVGETVAELDRLVRTGNGDSVITRLAILQIAVTDLQAQVVALETRVRVAGEKMADLSKDQDRRDAGKNAVWEIAKVVAWVATTGIAVYAAIWGKS